MDEREEEIFQFYDYVEDVIICRSGVWQNLNDSMMDGKNLYPVSLLFFTTRLNIEKLMVSILAFLFTSS